ncbi:hypothetical protein [Helicobacter sp. MIT 14-3879]|uniref:hypothetical protein n=1 Tax=Helicobacter sp. MIT 14-3879 TaxID=2040649 RepID=UPI000E1F86E8|nr:hypothetical protein [Helicobacter sp. MIT 14-3879]RDU60576.1 hypothetical protein CQA44_10455 [Helicobacter sp. MIT 14-3879]
MIGYCPPIKNLSGCISFGSNSVLNFKKDEEQIIFSNFLVEDAMQNDCLCCSFAFLADSHQHSACFFSFS